MVRSRWLILTALVAVTAMTSSVSLAQDAGSLGLGSGKKLGAQRSSADRPAWSGAGRSSAANRFSAELYGYGYWGQPWWIAKTQRQFRSVDDGQIPRLGLSGLYAGRVRGLRLPVDENPIEDYRLPPFRGVVRSPQTPEWLYKQQRAAKAGKTPSKVITDAFGLRLIRAGEYKAAGRLQAAGFKKGDDPRYPLYLAESLFALGKFKHAELVLQHAFADDATFAMLPDDVASHFSSKAVFEQKLAKLLDQAQAPLLKAYMLLFSRDGSKGLDALLALMAANEKDEAPGKLYRHYLKKAFEADDHAAGHGEAGGEAPKS